MKLAQISRPKQPMISQHLKDLSLDDLINANINVVFKHGQVIDCSANTGDYNLHRLTALGHKKKQLSKALTLMRP